jgi:hypothetical protein
MYEKKQHNVKSPDIKAMKAVVIDSRTRIYIPLDADPEEARNRYLSRFADKKV